MAHSVIRRSPLRSLVRAPRRKTVWFQFQPVTQSLTVAGGTILFSLNAAALALRPFTVVRSRFELFLRSDQQGITEDQVAALGIAVVSDEAVAVGVTAVPTPITQMGSDLWFVHQILMSGLAVVTAVGAFNRGARYTIDSRAMRKCSIGQDLVVVAESGAALVGEGSVMNVSGRMLVKIA